MSFGQGKGNVAFLRKRFDAMSESHCCHGMDYSEDRTEIAEWAPLVVEGRDEGTPVAATRMITGTDVSYGELTHLLVKHLRSKAAARIAEDAEARGTTLREAALASGHVDAATFDRVCDPKTMVGDGVAGA